jgi:hypothetical protein
MESHKSNEDVSEENYYEEVDPEEYHLAKKKINTQKQLYLFMLGLLITGAAILIIY